MAMHCVVKFRVVPRTNATGTGQGAARRTLCPACQTPAHPRTQRPPSLPPAKTSASANQTQRTVTAKMCLTAPRWTNDSERVRRRGRCCVLAGFDCRSKSGKEKNAFIAASLGACLTPQPSHPVCTTVFQCCVAILLFCYWSMGGSQGQHGVCGVRVGATDFSPDRHLLQYLQYQVLSDAPADSGTSLSLITVSSKTELPSVVTLSCWHSLPADVIRRHILAAVDAGACGDDALLCPVGACTHALLEWEVKASCIPKFCAGGPASVLLRRRHWRQWQSRVVTSLLHCLDVAGNPHAR